MSRLPSGPRGRAAAQTKQPVRNAEPAGASPAKAHEGKLRVESLKELCEHCSAAQRIAEAHGEKLLAYLLSMAAQEGAVALRRHATLGAVEPKQI